MDSRLNAPWLALRFGIGLTATLAGLDKFFNLLTEWPAYVSPLVTQVLPMSIPAFMAIIGIVEIAVGIAILTNWTRLGAYIAAAWLAGIAVNLVAAGYFDIAVRDVVMALAAFTLARLTEVRSEASVPGFRGVVHQSARHVDA